MTQLYYRYGAMNSGKTIEILKVAHNYEEQGKPILLLTSSTDTRSGVGVISSRIGLQRSAIPITSDMDIAQYVEREISYTPACVLVDESQFLSRENVLSLVNVVDNLNIPVMCFGLKNDFRNQLFEGSQYLLLYADKIEEIKTICQWCGHKAIMNLRTCNGHPVKTGHQIQIGGSETYIPVCRHHWFNPKLNSDGTVKNSQRV